jgi:hypothetical protein
MCYMLYQNMLQKKMWLPVGITLVLLSFRITEFLEMFPG